MVAALYCFFYYYCCYRYKRIRNVWVPTSRVYSRYLHVKRLKIVLYWIDAVVVQFLYTGIFSLLSSWFGKRRINEETLRNTNWVYNSRLTSESEVKAWTLNFATWHHVHVAKLSGTALLSRKLKRYNTVQYFRSSLQYKPACVLFAASDRLSIAYLPKAHEAFIDINKPLLPPGSHYWELLRKCEWEDNFQTEVSTLSTPTHNVRNWSKNGALKQMECGPNILPSAHASEEYMALQQLSAPLTGRQLVHGCP